MEQKEHVRNIMNRYGMEGVPFIFLIDFLMKQPVVLSTDDASEVITWKTPHAGNLMRAEITPELKTWRPQPVPFNDYLKGFELIQKHIRNGDTYLLNYTQPTPVETNLSLESIYQISEAPYKIMYRNKFICFSPEPFVIIKNRKIYSFPMKGTIDAGTENACKHIIADKKEFAEHNTIVDLIRNDLSLIADKVTVEDFRYLQKIKTNQNDLWQVSSKISGVLPSGYEGKIGDLIFSMLPAGSVSGAPKEKTIQIIRTAEGYDRGFYTGIFGFFDGINLDSCVLIRFIELQNGQMVFKSGGGITFMSRAEDEYEEMLKKVYVPVG